MNLKLINKLVFLFILILVIGACQPNSNNNSPSPSPTTSETQAKVTTTISFPQPTELPLVIPSPTARIGLPCAIPTEFELLFTLEDPSAPYGLCFLYPSDFVVTQSEVLDTWYFTGTPYGSGEMVAGTVELHIESANGKMLEQYAHDAVAKAAPGVKSGLDLIYLMPDDTPAMKTEGLPGLVSSRTLYLVHNNTAFILTFMPLDPAFEEPWLDMERAYSAITSTWTFTR